MRLEPSAVLQELLVVAAVLLAMALIRSGRRPDATARGYLLTIAAVLVLALVALVQSSAPLGVAALALTVLVVVLPAVLEVLVRQAFARGRLRLAVMLAGARAHLMPGAGLGRQQDILEGLAILEREGADRALQHFQALAKATEGTGELSLIHEQIVAMLFFDQRWSDAIVHYETRFTTGYAAMRPALALGLLRAYGEEGRLDVAASLLRALEEGPVGANPRALGLLAQARLTFLAYVGAAAPVSAALTGERHKDLGLSAASGALLRGIALARAGDREAAQAELARVAELAHRRDSRVVEASRSVLTRVSSGDNLMPPLQPEVANYAEAVAERLAAFSVAAPRWKRARGIIATPVVMLAAVVAYAMRLRATSSVALLDLGGLTPQLWQAGAYERAVTGLFVQGDVFSLLLDLYGLWLAGSLVERLTSPGRMLWIAMGGGAAGLAIAAMMLRASPSILIGSHLLTTAVIAGGLVLMHPRRTPHLAPRLRRGALLSLAFVLGALLLVGLRGGLLLGTPFVGYIVAGAIGAAAALPLPRRRLERVLGGTATVLALAVAVAWGWTTWRVDAAEFVWEQRVEGRDAGARWQLPRHFHPTSAYTSVRLPVVVSGGFLDMYALGNGALVQLLTAQGGDETNTPALLAAAPELERELRLSPTEVPVGFATAYGDAGGDADRLRAHQLWRNGSMIGLTIERPMGTKRALLVVAPADALEGPYALYAAILATVEPAA